MILDNYNDEILFFDESEDKEELQGSWKILIVDDETIVHDSTKMVLSDFYFENKTLEFISAYNSDQAKEILHNETDIAIILLDVVMETDDSGLRLVKYIRDVMKNKFIRIILRTGQPSEEDVVLNYDINDYKMKIELTLQKLLTTIISALRAYSNMMDLESSRKGLKKIIDMESELYEVHGIKEFASLLIKNVKTMYNIGEDSFYLRKYHGENQKVISTLYAGTGKYKKYIGKTLPDNILEDLLSLFDDSEKKNNCVYCGDEYFAFYKSLDIIENYVYFNGLDKLNHIEKSLFKIFISNISVAFDNIGLNEKLIQSQAELINRLSDVIEARSEEVAFHVERVAEIAYLLAKKIGLSCEDSSLLKLVAPLHDVGKIGIPESILNKPGKLTDKEYEIVKEHAMIGYRILKGSGLEILEAGALVAKEHHEFWNGKGYPSGLSGEDIHIFGRITIVADVFDALGHKRVYKEAWSFDEVMDYMVNNSGIMFDPYLIDVLVESKLELMKIYLKDK